MRVVQIGVGGWGKNHARILNELGLLVGVCDTSDYVLSTIPENVHVYKSVSAALKFEKFDTAFVCTPTVTHFKIASILLNAGKNVFVEKPLTYKSDESEELIKLAEKNRVVLTCGYIERFNPIVSYFKEKLIEGKYGDLLMLEFHRENRLPKHVKDVGIIYDTIVHDIDTANWLFDAEPETVFAISGKYHHNHEDFATVTLSYPKNKVAVITANWITPNRERTFRAVCTESMVKGDFIKQEIQISENNDTHIPKLEDKEPLLIEIRSFLDAIINKKELVVTAKQALAVTKIAEACVESSEKGKPIYI